MPSIFKRRGILRAAKGGSVKRTPGILKGRYKSGLERRAAEQIEAAGLDPQYEGKVIKYIRPARASRYTPDFPIGPKPIYIEIKGRFRGASERQKMILARDQNPEADIRIVFQKADLPIYKGSPTSHGKWATDNGFVWVDGGVIPDEWLDEAKGRT